MSYGGDLQALKSWVGMRLMWNPLQSTDALIAQFLQGYYGKTVAPYVRKHIDLIVASANATGQTPLTIDVGYDASYLTAATCLAVLANLQDARNASAASRDVNPADALTRIEAIELGTVYTVRVGHHHHNACTPHALRTDRPTVCVWMRCV